MALDALISEYFLAESELRMSIEIDRASGRRANALRRAADRLDAIERHEPRSTAEARDKVFFFMVRAIKRPGVSVDGRDINLVLTLIGNPDCCHSSAYAAPEPETEEAARAAQSGPDEGSSLIRFVTTSRERVSLFDEDVRYIATSEVNAAFYGTRPVRLLGLHLADVIGDAMYRDLAAARFEAASRGEPQEYYYDIEVGGTTYRCRCGIKPVDLNDGRRGFLVFNRDVTRELELRDESLFAVPEGADLARRRAGTTLRS